MPWLACVWWNRGWQGKGKPVWIDLTQKQLLVKMRVDNNRSIIHHLFQNIAASRSVRRSSPFARLWIPLTMIATNSSVSPNPFRVCFHPRPACVVIVNLGVDPKKWSDCVWLFSHIRSNKLAASWFAIWGSSSNAGWICGHNLALIVLTPRLGKMDDLFALRIYTSAHPRAVCEMSWEVVGSMALVGYTHGTFMNGCVWESWWIQLSYSDFVIALFPPV